MRRRLALAACGIATVDALALLHALTAARAEPLSAPTKAAVVAAVVVVLTAAILLGRYGRRIRATTG